jgi:hypothetical protein
VAHIQSRAQAEGYIQAWCLKHIGLALAVTHEKDMNMYQLWDDRAVQVIENTGNRVDGSDNL